MSGELKFHQLPGVNRMAVMGGAYGNLPALDACIMDTRSQNCDMLCFIGDAIGFCGHSDEVIDTVINNFDILVSGNHEQQAVGGEETCGCGYSSPEDERLGCLAFEYALGSLSEDNIRWLSTWPDAVLIQCGGKRVLLCHGSPERTNEFLYESEIEESQIAGYLKKFDVDGFVCTHTGLPWVYTLEDGRFALNCGVVGKPDNDGDPAVHYGVLEFSGSKVEIDVRRVHYDHLTWAGRLEEEGVEDVFVSPLRTGLWTCGVASLPAREREMGGRART